MNMPNFAACHQAMRAARVASSRCCSAIWPGARGGLGLLRGGGERRKRNARAGRGGAEELQRVAAGNRSRDHGFLQEASRRRHAFRSDADGLYDADRVRVNAARAMARGRWLYCDAHQGCDVLETYSFSDVSSVSSNLAPVMSPLF